MDNNSANLTVNGTNVITWTFSNTSDNTNGWTPGAYMVKVTAQGATKVEKVIVR